MRIFVTGATGYIGGAVAAALQRHGHEVHALAHNAEAAEQIGRSGWKTVHGDLRDAGGLVRAASRLDAVIHAGTVGGEDAGAVDLAATRALIEASGTGRPLIYTSGAWVLGSGVVAEASPRRPARLVAWRGALEEEVLTAGVHAVVIRPGIVYGRGGGIPGMVARGELPVIGSGRQRWALVHVDDLAELYVLALSAAAGSVLHGVSETFTMENVALAGAAAELNNGPEYIGIDAAVTRYGAFAEALVLDQVVSAAVTRSTTGWQPSAPGLLRELLHGSYAAARAAMV